MEEPIPQVEPVSVQPAMTDQKPETNREQIVRLQRELSATRKNPETRNSDPEGNKAKKNKLVEIQRLESEIDEIHERANRQRRSQLIKEEIEEGYEASREENLKIAEEIAKERNKRRGFFASSISKITGKKITAMDVLQEYAILENLKPNDPKRATMEHEKDFYNAKLGGSGKRRGVLITQGPFIGFILRL